MKNLFLIVGLFLLFIACTHKELDKETALKMLQEQKGYPKTIDIDVFVGDPAFARRLIDAGLEKDGYVEIAHTQKLIDLGKPIITFTEKSKPYLIAQTEENKKNNVQRVKVAEEVIDEVLNVKLSDEGKTAVVDFKNSFRDKTPFFKIARIKESKAKIDHLDIIVR